MWNQPANQLHPWMRSVSEYLAYLDIAPFEGRTIYALSDYVVGDKNSQYDVIGILIVDEASCAKWNQQRLIIRQQFLPDGRRMAYKSLNDRLRMQALDPFLSAADQMNGVCISIAINRLIPNQVVDLETFNAQRRGEFNNQWHKNWKLRPFQHSLQVALLTAYFVAGLASEGQRLMWVSDQDEAFANLNFHIDTGNFFTRCLGTFGIHPKFFSSIAISTSEIDCDGRYFEDLLAIPDIAAGLTAKYLTSICKELDGDRLPLSTCSLSLQLKPKVDRTIKWFTTHAGMLQKIGLYQDPCDSPSGIPLHAFWTPFRRKGTEYGTKE